MIGALLVQQFAVQPLEVAGDLKGIGRIEDPGLGAGDRE